MSGYFICLAFLLTFPKIYFVQTEFFTAVRHLGGLVDVEKSLAKNLSYYVKEEETKLNRIRQYLHKSQHLLEINSSEEVSKYVGNPFNLVRLLKRLNTDWGVVESLLHVNFSQGFAKYINARKNDFPTDVDFQGAQEGLMRLQEVYRLTSTTITDGIEPGAPAATQMNAEDAFSIGRDAYLNNDLALTEVWMAETLRLLDLGRIGKTEQKLDRFAIIDHLAWAEYKNGKIEAALNHTKELHALNASNARILSNYQLFEQMLEDQRKDMSDKLTDGQVEDTMAEKLKKYPKFYYTPEENGYERYLIERSTAMKLCRGETKPLPKSSHFKLVCWYKRDNPLFVMKPLKIERIYLKPEILLFKGLITDSEIEKIKEVAKPVLERASVHNPTTGKLEHASYRISESGWLTDDDDPVIAKIDQRIVAGTGLSLDTAEKLQVGNYGIGGHYDTHFDFSRLTPIRPPPWLKDRTKLSRRVPKKHEPGFNPPTSSNDGNRIATVLIYMSDVVMGGGTVFNNLHAKINPIKGDAVFWYNLHRDGSGDFDTRHAACPVLVGDKWVANKWIHERGQEFRRPCGLTPDAS